MTRTTKAARLVRLIDINCERLFADEITRAAFDAQQRRLWAASIDRGIHAEVTATFNARLNGVRA